jgi:hypothetical protein
VLSGLVGGADLAAAGYVQLAGESAWWAPSGRAYLSPGDHDSAAQELAEAQGHFFLPRRAVDPFGGIARVSYDVHDLLPLNVTDPVGNQTTAANDYRVLAPVLVTDANGNRAAVVHDALGLVAASAVMGPASGSLGDSLAGVEPDPDPATLSAFYANPVSNGPALLGSATTRLLYDLDAYQASGAPPVAATLARETHVSDLAPGQASQVQYGLAYSDGLGRVVQSKARVADGPVTDGGANASPRWLGSGWTIFDNKGRPVRRYEPFFTATSAFEFAAQHGVATTLLYDAAGRAVATLHPDQSWTKTVFDAWRQEAWDGNDTVLIADPRTDADVGGYFARLLGAVVFTSWYNTRIGGADAIAAATAAKTAVHAATPAVTHLDALSRACLAVGDCGGGQRFPARTKSTPTPERGRPSATVPGRPSSPGTRASTPSASPATRPGARRNALSAPRAARPRWPSSPSGAKGRRPAPISPGGCSGTTTWRASSSAPPMTMPAIWSRRATSSPPPMTPRPTGPRSPR